MAISGRLAISSTVNRQTVGSPGAFGYGGLRLFAFPERALSVAIAAGNYNDGNQWMPPIRVVREVVLASMLY
jgi:hypothetical protein